MANLKLVVERRSGTGRRACRVLRREGRIPAVLYGRNQEVIPLMVTAEALRSALKVESPIVDLDVAGKPESALIKDVQYDPMGETILHVDFTRVAMDEEIEIAVPIEPRGRPAGAEEGGVLEQTVKEIQVTCLPSNIPNAIVVDISALKLGDSLHVRELTLPPGVRTAVAGEIVVFLVARPLEEKPEAAEEKERLEPELIRPEGRGEAEEKEAVAEEEKKKGGEKS
ncbi:MAG: 50S ribosomal protein L25 [Planctomycetes bacterium]|nr:50S ribosomal protein L25 [Planctomycetota bacterium]